MTETAGTGERWFRELLEALPAALYVTDAEGRVQFYNSAFVDMAGFEPLIGSQIALKLFLPDGTPVPDASCPMSLARKECRAVRASEMLIERPDGTRKALIAYPKPLSSDSGRSSSANWTISRKSLASTSSVRFWA